jgi:hypothetical protein
MTLAPIDVIRMATPIVQRQLAGPLILTGDHDVLVLAVMTALVRVLAIGTIVAMLTWFRLLRCPSSSFVA